MQKKMFRSLSLLYILFFSLNSVVCFPHEKQQHNKNCSQQFSLSCHQTFIPKASSKSMHYYSSLPVEDKPTAALVVIHGFKHDVKRTFNAGLLAAKKAHRIHDTVIIAPIFYVDNHVVEYKHCVNTYSQPADVATNLVWSCDGWMEGSMADNDDRIGSFDVLDELVDEIHRNWPSIKTITIAGFSAGGQAVQRYIGYAAQNKKVHMRYVISDPNTWLYFDPQRPVLQKNGISTNWQTCLSMNMKNCSFHMKIPDQEICPSYNDWKYGSKNMPSYLKRSITEAKIVYSKADVHYMEGALDSSNEKGSVYELLDKSCAAMLQGPYRMQRGLSFAAYDRLLIAPEKKRRVVIIPNCKHNVTCVFSSKQAQHVLFAK